MTPTVLPKDSGPSLNDRSPQYLPVPMGGAAPVRVRRSRRVDVHLLTARAATWLTWLGIASAAVGASLMLAGGPAQVSARASSVRVGAMILRWQWTAGHTTAYTGGAAYVLTEPGDGTARAAAAWSADARSMNTATCQLWPQHQLLVEDCSFAIGGAVFTCVDSFDLHSGGPWRRTYADGRRVDIAVDPNGAVVPVPFPIGR